MVKNPPEGYTRVSPYLYYEKPADALDWLKEAFGLTEKLRVPDEERGVAHAELELDGSVIMLGRPLDSDFKNPKNLGAVTSAIYVYVDDVDSHYAAAKAAGTEIIRELEDQSYGDRQYAAVDPEGHHWYFSTHVKDVSLEEMSAGAASS
jgi:PhnB protein